MMLLADLFVHVYVLVDDAISIGASPSPDALGPGPPAPMPRCSPSPWCATSWGALVRLPSWKR